MQMTSHMASREVDLMVQSGKDRVQQEAAGVTPSRWSLVCDQWISSEYYTSLLILKQGYTHNSFQFIRYT